MKALIRCSRLFLRFRYPVTLPEDIAYALGIEVSNFDTFDTFIKKLTHPSSLPTKLAKYMPKNKVDEAFSHAQKKEHFGSTSLYSFYFSEGWMEFKLEFDPNSLLRRIYIHHRRIQAEQGIEMRLG